MQHSTPSSEQRRFCGDIHPSRARGQHARTGVELALVVRPSDRAEYIAISCSKEPATMQSLLPSSVRCGCGFHQGVIMEGACGDLRQRQSPASNGDAFGDSPYVLDKLHPPGVRYLKRGGLDSFALIYVNTCVSAPLFLLPAAADLSECGGPRDVALRDTTVQGTRCKGTSHHYVAVAYMVCVVI